MEEFGYKRKLELAEKRSDSMSWAKKDSLPNGKKTKGRVKIKMEFIDNKLRRYTTFSKRKTGIMKKAYELSTLTGTQVMLLVASETGHVYTFATKKLQPMITSEAGKALIQTCLNSPDEGDSEGKEGGKRHPNKPVSRFAHVPPNPACNQSAVVGWVAAEPVNSHISLRRRRPATAAVVVVVTSDSWCTAPWKSSFSRARHPRSRRRLSQQ